MLRFHQLDPCKRPSQRRRAFHFLSSIAFFAFLFIFHTNAQSIPHEISLADSHAADQATSLFLLLFSGGERD
jgi:hypothetical protein